MLDLHDTYLERDLATNFLSTRSYGEKNSGFGQLDFEKVGSKTVVSSAFAKAPLRLMNPGNYGNAAWVYTSNYGGGMLGGDAVHLKLRLRKGSKAALLSQSSNKIYRSSTRAQQNLYAEIESDASLIILPDPVVCYANSSFQQIQEIHLHDSASLLLIDTFSSGRSCFGERWLFNTLENQMRVFRDKKLIFLESLRLDSTMGSLHSRMGRFDAIGIVLFFGSDFEKYGSEISEFLRHKPVQTTQAVVTANTLASEGTLLRIAASSVEELGNILRETLQFLPGYLGDNPWARKF